MTTIQVEGLADVRKNLKDFGIDIDHAIKKALVKAAEKVMNLSRSKVPVQSGTLRDSISFALDGDTVSIGYDAPYAVSVHERTERSGAKFLENALNEFSGAFQETFADELKKVLA